MSAHFLNVFNRCPKKNLSVLILLITFILWKVQQLLFSKNNVSLATPPISFWPRYCTAGANLRAPSQWSWVKRFLVRGGGGASLDVRFRALSTGESRTRPCGSSVGLAFHKGQDSSWGWTPSRRPQPQPSMSGNWRISAPAPTSLKQVHLRRALQGPRPPAGHRLSDHRRRPPGYTLSWTLPLCLIPLSPAWASRVSSQTN